MAYPVFVQENALTREGEHLIEWIEVQFAEADRSNDLMRLNSLSGPVAEYYTLVAKLGLKTPKAWIESLPQSARNAYDLMKYVEAQAAQAATVDKTASQADTIANELAAFKEQMSAELAKRDAEIERLREATTTRKPRKGKDAEADEPVTTETPEADTPEATTEE